jgi:chromosome segregation ATPase
VPAERSSHPRRRGPTPTRRNPARRQLRYQHTLAREAGVDRTAFYGTRPYAHLREEFETRLARIREAGDPIGPSEGQISRLMNENAKLKARLAQANSEIGDLTEFRTTALARLAAQHEENTRLRNLTQRTHDPTSPDSPDRRKRSSGHADHDPAAL